MNKNSCESSESVWVEKEKRYPLKIFSGLKIVMTTGNKSQSPLENAVIFIFTPTNSLGGWKGANVQSKNER